jgi:uncharacterized membrane protein
MAAEGNFDLFVATYADEGAADDDFKAIKELDDIAVIAAVVLQRDGEGKVTVKEHGGSLVKGGTAVGVVAGFVVGLFAPPLLAATAIGAAAGGIGKHHEEKKAGDELQADDWLPVNSSAIVAVVDDQYLDRIGKVVTKAATWATLGGADGRHHRAGARQTLPARRPGPDIGVRPGPSAV